MLFKTPVWYSIMATQQTNTLPRAPPISSLSPPIYFYLLFSLDTPSSKAFPSGPS